MPPWLKDISILKRLFIRLCSTSSCISPIRRTCISFSRSSHIMCSSGSSSSSLFNAASAFAASSPLPSWTLYVSTGSSIGFGAGGSMPSPSPGFARVSPHTAHTLPANASSTVLNFAPEYILSWSAFSFHVLLPSVPERIDFTFRLPDVTLINVSRAP